MKRAVVLFLVHIFLTTGYAQMTKLEGAVKIQNSKIKSGVVEYASGVQVKHEKAKPNISDSKGYFALQIVGIEPNSQIVLTVIPSGKYANYIVVNKRDLENITLGRKEGVTVYICDEAEFENRFQELYEVNLKTNEENYRKEIETLKKELAKLKKSNKRLEASHLEDSLRRTENIKNNMNIFLRDISEKMTRLDLDESEILQKAYMKMSEGNLQEALLLMPKDMLEERFLEGDIMANLGSKIKKDVVELWTMKARIYTLIDFNEACANYEEVLKRDSLNYDLAIEYALYLKANYKINAAKKVLDKYIADADVIFKNTGVDNIPAKAKVYFILGELFSLESNYSKSNEQFDEAEYYYTLYSKVEKEAATISLISIQMLKGQNALHQKQWEKAEEYYMKALDLIQTGNQEAAYQEMHATMYMLLAEIYRTQSDYAKAIIHIKKAIKLYEIIKEENKDLFKYNSLLAFLASIEAMTGDFEEARKNIEQAIIFAGSQNLDSLSLEQTDDIASIYLLSSDVFENLNETKNAAIFHVKGWQIIYDLAKKHPQMYADTYFNYILEDLKVEEGLEETKPKLDTHIKKYKALAKEDPAIHEINYASLLFRAGIYHCQQGDSIKFKRYFAEASKMYDYQIETFPDKYLDFICDDYLSIAKYFVDNNEFDMAAIYHNKSEECCSKIISKNPDKGNEQYAMLLKDIASQYKQVNKNDIAEKYYLRSCDISEKLYSNDLSVYAVLLLDTYLQLSYIYHDNADFNASLAYKDKALEIAFMLSEKKPVIYKRMYTLLLATSINSYINLGNYTEADKVAKKALELMNSLDSAQVNDNKELIVLIYNSYAEVRSHFWEYDIAEEYYLKAYRIYSEMDIKYLYHPENEMKLYINIGHFYNKKEEVDVARKYIIEGMNVYNDYSQLTKKKLLRLYIALKEQLGISYLQKDILKAEPILMEALDDYSNLFGDNIELLSLHQGYIYNRLGFHYKEQKEYEKAASYLTQSLNLRRMMEISNEWVNYELAVSSHNLALCKQKLGNINEAISLAYESKSLVYDLAKDLPQIYWGLYNGNVLLLSQMLSETETPNDFVRFEGECITEVKTIIERDKTYQYGLFNLYVNFSTVYWDTFKDINKATMYLEQAGQIYSKLEDKVKIDYTKYVDLLHAIPEYHCSLNNFETAKRIIDQFSDFYNNWDLKMQEKHTQYKYLMQLDMALYYFRNQENEDKAVKLIREIQQNIESLDSLSLANKMTLLSAYDNYTTWLFSKKSYDEAKVVLGKYITLLSDIPVDEMEADNSRLFSICYYYMGEVKLIEKDYEGAEKEFNRFTEAFESYLKRDTIEVMNSMNGILFNIPHLYYKAGDNEKCDAYIVYILDKVKEIDEETFLAALLANIDHYNSSNEFDMSKKYVVYLFDKANSEEDPNLKNLLLTVLYYYRIFLDQHNNYQNSGEYFPLFFNSYFLCEQISDNFNPIVFYVLSVLNENFPFDNESFVKIEPALDRFAQHITPTQETIVATKINNCRMLFYLAEYYYKNNYVSKAIPIFNIIISQLDNVDIKQIDAKLLRMYVQSCQYVTFFLMDGNQQEEYQVILNKGLEYLNTYVKQTDNSPEDMAVLHKYIAQFYLLNQEYNQAAEHYAKVIDYVAGIAPKSAVNKITYGLELEQYAKIFFLLKEYNTVISLYKQAAGLYEDVLADNPNENELINTLLSTYHSIYSAYMEICDYESALLYSELQASMLKKHSAIFNHFDVMVVHLDHVNMLLVLNKTKEALAYYNKITDIKPTPGRYLFFKFIFQLINNNKDEALEILNETIKVLKETENEEMIFKMLGKELEILLKHNDVIQKQMTDEYFDLINAAFNAGF